MDLGLLFAGFFILDWLVNLIILLGVFTLGYITYSAIYYVNYYLIFKCWTTNEIEYKYISILEENKMLKQKLVELEDEHNQLFNQLLEQLKDR
jgi:hypothetical protein